MLNVFVMTLITVDMIVLIVLSDTQARVHFETVRDITGITCVFILGLVAFFTIQHIHRCQKSLNKLGVSANLSWSRLYVAFWISIGITYAAYFGCFIARHYAIDLKTADLRVEIAESVLIFIGAIFVCCLDVQILVAIVRFSLRLDQEARQEVSASSRESFTSRPTSSPTFSTPLTPDISEMRQSNDF